MTRKAQLNLASLDLNLMVVFDALMAEGHLTRAANRVGLSQPAMSHALRRLRSLLGDELFIRGPGGMTPTARARALADPIGAALDKLRSALAGEPDFDPTTATRTFRLQMSDGASARRLPPLVRRLRAEAPGIDLHVVAGGPSEGLELVLSGAVDLSVGVHPHLPDGLDSEVLVSVPFKCIADAAHPDLANGLDLQRFLDLPHVAVSIGQEVGASIDFLLDTMGLRRRIMLSVPHFLAVPGVVVGTDLIAVMPVSLLRPEDLNGLRAHALPIPSLHVAMRLIWRTRRDDDPALRWLRGMLADAYRGVNPSPRVGAT